MGFKIYPPIGIARVGNSATRFFVGPESPGHPGLEPDGNVGESAIKQYKVGVDEIKRQAARFHVFEIPDGGGPPRPAVLPPGAIVEWTVHLVNKKAAVVRQGNPPPQPRRPQLAPGSTGTLIDPQARSIADANASGVKFDTGEFLGRRVSLGELRTDRRQNLLVLGGFGSSSSPNNAGFVNFYTNPGWQDDVSDGPVRARIRLAGGNVIEDIAPAWVIVAPPDFAPEIQGVVTLFDVLSDLGVRHLGVVAPSPVSFTRHVFPLLHRTHRLQWVNEAKDWASIGDDWPALADSSVAASALRAATREVVLEIEGVLKDYKLTDLQKSFLDQWVDGTFVSDWIGIPAPSNQLTAEGLTRAALEAAVGQGFFPGIEAGILLTDQTLYTAPFDFRLEHSQINPGDLTALMAVPWQADFFDCEGIWWPSQRPDDVFPGTTTTARANWARGISGKPSLVRNFAKLAFITAQTDSQGNVVFAESQRAPQAQIV